MRILAVDPGKMTGLAETFVTYTRSLDLTSGALQLKRWELPYLEALDAAADIILEDGVDTVVCENYIVGMGTVRKAQGENWSLRSIGALEWMCHNANTKFVLQKPADAKAFSTDEKLHEIGWWL